MSYDPLFDVARKTVDDVLGEGEYARLNADNPGVPGALRRKLKEATQMANENRIVKVEIHLIGEEFVVDVTKEFEERYGGGSQTFREPGGHNLHYALDVARGMVTLSPGRRTDLEVG